jgi:hypothetical protein
MHACMRLIKRICGFKKQAERAFCSWRVVSIGSLHAEMCVCVFVQAGGGVGPSIKSIQFEIHDGVHFDKIMQRENIACENE